jgi:2,3-dihydroxybiphenyl 1,2-dioxygenase
MAELDNLSYAVFSVSDLGAWRAFATGVVGLVPGAEDDHWLALRMDEHAYRVMLEKGGDDDLVAAGWELGSAESLAEYVARLETRGAPVRRADKALEARRGVDALYLCDDPNGFTHEFFATRAPLGPDKAFKSPLLRGRGFVTGPLGIGHILPVSKDYQQSIKFYRDVLGLRLSDDIEQEIAPGIHARASFFHTKSGRHHSLATGQFPSPKKLNHFMLEYQDMNDVGAAYDRAVAAGVPLILELGHHPNDEAFSFYMRTPSGFGLELAWGSIVIDDSNWTPKTHNRMSDWGHKRRDLPVAELSTGAS